MSRKSYSGGGKSGLRENLLESGGDSTDSKRITGRKGKKGKRASKELTDSERLILMSRMKEQQGHTAPSSSESAEVSPPRQETDTNLLSADVHSPEISILLAAECDLPDTASEREKVFAAERFRWDFVLVVPNPDYPEYEKGEASMTYTQIVGTLRAGYLQYYSYYSSTGEYIIIKLRACLARLEVYAEAIGYKVLLDEDKLAAAASQGVRDTSNGTWRVKPIHINGNPSLSKIRPCQVHFPSLTAQLLFYK